MCALVSVTYNPGVHYTVLQTIEPQDLLHQHILHANQYSKVLAPNHSCPKPYLTSVWNIDAGSQNNCVLGCSITLIVSWLGLIACPHCMYCHSTSAWAPGSDDQRRLTVSFYVVALQPYGSAFRREVGPVNLKFTIPMYAISGLHLHYLHITRREWSPNTQRWVRYVSTSSSYVFRT